MTSATPLPEHWTDGFVESNGVRLHYARTGGDHPPLVIAHGVFDDGPCRAPLASALEAEHDVVLYDARGHGRSDAPDSGYSVDDRVADLVGLVEALDLDDPVLFGHSMGGDTAAATAASHPDLARAVVMEDPAALLHHGGTDREADLEAISARIEWWHEHTKDELLEVDDELRGHVAAGDDSLASLLADARLRVSPAITTVFERGFVDPAETYSKIAAPTLILRADVDETVKARDRAVSDRLENGRLVHIEGAGHCVFRDQRAIATHELRSFLDGLDGEQP